MNKFIQIQVAVAFTVSILLFILSDLYILSIIGTGLFVFFFLKFFFDLGSKIEIRDVIILIALLQWIVGPVLYYHLITDDIFYFMAVDESIYMNFVFFASILFISGLYFPLNKRQQDNQQILNRIKLLFLNKNYEIIIIIVGFVFEISYYFLPQSLRFFLYLFSCLKYFGVYLLFVNNHKWKWLISSIVLFETLVIAINNAIFHEFLLWISFFVLIIAYILKPSIYKKAVYGLFTVLIIVIIQTAKFEFRQLMTSSSNKTMLFANVVQSKLSNYKDFTSESNVNTMIIRINQGWIIARIMSYTPKFEPFAKGETIKESLMASILPRFLAPNKLKAGGRNYFKRFTGKDISESTSMGLSTLGEAYANFGIAGGAIFMFFLGLFFNFVLHLIYKISVKHPTIILFIPILFLQVIKAETDFSTVINHLFKASIVVWMIYFGFRKILGINL